MKIRHKIAAGIAATVLALGLAATPANATWATTAVNVGSQSIAIQRMSGAVATVYPGGSTSQAGYLIRGPRQCFEVNGVRGCNVYQTTSDRVWLSDGTKYIKRVSNFVYLP